MGDGGQEIRGTGLEVHQFSFFVVSWCFGGLIRG